MVHNMLRLKVPTDKKFDDHEEHWDGQEYMSSRAASSSTPRRYRFQEEPTSPSFVSPAREFFELNQSHHHRHKPSIATKDPKDFETDQFPSPRSPSFPSSTEPINMDVTRIPFLHHMMHQIKRPSSYDGSHPSVSPKSKARPHKARNTMKGSHQRSPEPDNGKWSYTDDKYLKTSMAARTLAGLELGQMGLSGRRGKRILPRKLKTFLLTVSALVILLPLIAILDRLAASKSIQWGLDLSSTSSPRSAFLGRYSPDARIKPTGIAGRIDLSVYEDNEELEDELESEPVEHQVVVPVAETQYEVPEQRDLPKLHDKDREARDIPVEERLQLIKGLRRLAERMPLRYKAEPGQMKETRAWNVPHYKRLHNCLLTSLDDQKSLAKSDYMEFEQSDDLDLQSLSSCRKEELNVVIGGTFHFGASQFGRVSGEDIWARSTIDSYKALGYTFLYAFEIIESMDINLEIPSLVKMVMAESGHIRDCANWGIPGKERKLNSGDLKGGAKVIFWELKERATGKTEQFTDAQIKEENWNVEDPELLEEYEMTAFGFGTMYGQVRSDKPGRLDKASEEYEAHENWRCVKSDGFEEGLPLWKMFAWHFWETPSHPLGHQFTLSPEDYARYPTRQGKENNMFIGYSIEAYCNAPIPQAERTRRAYILAKHASYFDRPAYKYSHSAFSNMKKMYEIDFVAGSGKGENLPDDGIDNLGMLPRERFAEELGKSRALIGIGLPRISPTPYDALCQGVPFINPVTNWVKEDPEDQSRWTWQHEGLANIGAPYVYTVKHGDEMALQKAVADAVDTPIGKYIPPALTLDANNIRHNTLVEVDWQAVAMSKPMPADMKHCAM